MESEKLAAALPRGTRLLHIGLPKTGTTAVQSAAARNRSDLLRHGVCYPGQSVNHLYPVCALMGRRMGWSESGFVVPERHHWDQMVTELDDHRDGRALISHEFATECSDEQASQFVAELGPTTHVVITLRSFAALLPSSWQQGLKAGKNVGFEPWLTEILADDPVSGRARHFYRRNDQSAIVRRWVSVAGAERVIVVVADRERPNLLTDAFCDLLGVPRHLLRDGAANDGENRSMSWPEAEFVRRVNRTARAERLDWRVYKLAVRNGLVARMLRARRPSNDEPRMVLPPWAAVRATEIARGYAEQVLASGCEVIGDPEQLAAPGAVGELSPVDQVPLQAAAEGALGMLSASQGRGAFFDVAAGPVPVQLRRLRKLKHGRRWLELYEATPTATARDLMAVAALRTVRQVRHRVRPR